MEKNNNYFIIKHLSIIIIFIVISFVFNSFPHNGFISGGDFYQGINLEQTSHRYLYTWFNESGQGQYSSIFVAYPYYIFQLIFFKIGLSEGFITSTLLFFFLLFSYYSFFISTYVLNLKIKYGARIVFALLYSMNLFSFSILTYPWGFSHHFIIYIFIPLLLSLFYRTIQYGGKLNYALYALALLVSLMSYNNIAFLFTLFFIQGASLIPILFYKQKILLIKRYCLVFGIQLIITSFILITFYLSYKYQVENITNSKLIPTLDVVKRTSSSILNSFILTGSYWYFPQAKDIRYMGYEGYFIFSSVLTLVPIGLIVIGFVQKQKHTLYELFIWSAFFILTILTVRVSPPFEWINSFFYTYTLGVFRSPDKLITFYPYIVIILALIGFSKIKWSYKSILLPIVLSPSIFFLIGGVSGFLSKKVLSQEGEAYSFVVQIPQEYKDIQTKYFSGAEPTSTTIISLPFSVVNSINWANYPKWNYVGNDITRFLWNKNQIIANTYDHPVLENKFSFGDFNTQQTGSKEELLALFQKFSGEYIIFHKDISDEWLNKSQYIQKKIYELQESQDLIKLEDNDYFILYKLADKNLYPVIYSENSNIQFHRINPTKHKITIKNIKDKTEVRFNQSFNKLWNLYSSQDQKECDQLQSYNINSFKTTECTFDRKFFEGEELSYLWKQPLFEDSHKLVYDYANQWTIDPEYIKANFDKSMYKENPDGSIDVELTLYFKPQSYFYLGIIISGTTLILCLGYLGYAFYCKRGAKLSPHPEPRATLPPTVDKLPARDRVLVREDKILHPVQRSCPPLKRGMENKKLSPYSPTKDKRKNDLSQKGIIL
jgi:hypothetical protein